ncbi:MAG: hypothetical protein ABI207_08865 [Crocinitomicaceae bacterium]
MLEETSSDRSRTQESRHAIERMYITMRHLFNRGFYKPMGISGETLRESLLELRPEIYGSIGGEKVELSGLIYVLDRLPMGIEQCSFINLTSDEGYQKSTIKAIIPPKRKRNCYRIDNDQMNIEITRGRSDIYDVLTHLTFLFIESHKIARRVIIGETKNTIRDWEKLEQAVNKDKLTQDERETVLIYTANILGRTFEEILAVYESFATKKEPDRFLNIIYWLGKLAITEITENERRSITFSPVLRERLGHHIHGEVWANNIKNELNKNNLLHRPIHIISANMHSVMNYLYAHQALGLIYDNAKEIELFEHLSDSSNAHKQEKIQSFAQKHGLINLKDTSGTNIDVQIIDTQKLDLSQIGCFAAAVCSKEVAPVLVVMDYAFGEQAYETIDELLKPVELKLGKHGFMNVHSISIMGKAGILDGKKGDLMIPTAHIYEGTADNYPFKNELSKEDFKDCGLKVTEGTMITVLGTSLQNKDVLKYFKDSTWRVIGLEMEGAHYQKAIQSASKIRKSVSELVKVRYAYYASDNPLETGSTLASGGLGLTGVKPTYLITKKILEQILAPEF